MSDPTLAEYVAAHEELYAQYDDVCRRLTAEQLTVPSLCPEWDVRAVIAHAISVDSILDGWTPSTEDPPPFGRMAAAQAALAGLDPSALSERVAQITSARLEHLRSLGPGIVDVACITPTGIGTYGGFLRIRVFDLWVHRRDVAIPLAEDLDDDGAPAEMALAEVADSLGYIVGKKIGLPDGMSIVFHVTGPVGRDLAVAVDGRARVVDAVTAPDVELTTDVRTFVMLAAGRIDPDEQIAAGVVRWSGDDEWGGRAARSLAYTM